MEYPNLNTLLKGQTYSFLREQGYFFNFRKKLTDSGVILYKDASTNKGGVTSSSYEV